MTSAPGDRGREAVYAAEEAAFGGTDLDGARPLAALVELVADLVAGDWWRACGGPQVAVAPARAGASASSARCGAGDGVVIRLAGGQLTVATVAHELAHALAGVVRGHDERFRAAHVDVVAVLAGAGAAAELTRCYADLGVPAAHRTWPRPHRAVGPGFVIVP